jgi:hypothetical protein
VRIKSTTCPPLPAGRQVWRIVNLIPHFSFFLFRANTIVEGVKYSNFVTHLRHEIGKCIFVFAPIFKNPQISGKICLAELQWAILIDGGLGIMARIDLERLG